MSGSLLVVLCVVAIGDERPIALVAMEQQRRSLFSGRVEWTYEDNAHLADRRFRFIARYASNGDRLYERRGDQDGWVAWDIPSGKPAHRFPTKYLENADGVWQHMESSVSVQLWRHPGRRTPDAQLPPDGEEFQDIRFIGVFPWAAASFRHGADCIWRIGAADPDEPSVPASNVAFEERHINGKHVVTARLDDGARVEWTIDPQRGWNAERCVEYSPAGTPVREMVAELTEWDGHWFPSEVRFMQQGRATETYRVTSAAFNRADDPRSFSGADLGLEPGFNVCPKDFRVETRNGILYWDGDAAIPYDEFREAIRSQRVEYGPTIRAKQAAQGAPISPYLTPQQIAERERSGREMPFRLEKHKTLSVWEQYVHDFIQRYALEQDQAQMAMSILRECQKRGGDYLGSRKSAFVEAQQQLVESRGSSDPDTQRRAEERLRELRKPVDDIFELQLKPRLEKLPTRKQRADAAARQNAASRPSPKP